MKIGKFRDKNIISVLLVSLLGLGLLFLSEIMPKGICKNVVNQISLAVLISGILGIINEYILKKALIELILSKVELKEEIERAGLEEILDGILEINYKKYFKTATKNIDIVHTYGRTWTSNNIDEIMDRVRATKCKVRVVLVDPESPFVPALEKHFKYEEGELKRSIEKVSDTWKEKYNKLEKASNSGKIELYYHKGQPTNCMYRIDDRIIVVQTKTTQEKTTRLPAMIFKNEKREGCFFNIYENEINKLIKESRFIEFDK